MRNAEKERYRELTEYTKKRVLELLLPALPLPFRVAFELVAVAYNCPYGDHAKSKTYLDYLYPYCDEKKIFIDRDMHIIKKYGHKSNFINEKGMAALTLYMTRYHQYDKLRTIQYSQAEPVVIAFTADVTNHIDKRINSIPYEIMCADNGQEYKVYNRINNSGRDVRNIVIANSTEQFENYEQSLVTGTIIARKTLACRAFSLPEYEVKRVERK